MGGGEGVGIVREVGEKVMGIRTGDQVIPAGPALGNMQQFSRILRYLHYEYTSVVEH